MENVARENEGKIEEKEDKQKHERNDGEKQDNRENIDANKEEKDNEQKKEEKHLEEVYFPLVSFDGKELPIHFLSAEEKEVHKSGNLLSKWLHIKHLKTNASDDKSILCAVQKPNPRHELMEAYLEKYLKETSGRVEKLMPCENRECKNKVVHFSSKLCTSCHQNRFPQMAGGRRPCKWGGAGGCDFFEVSDGFCTVHAKMSQGLCRENKCENKSASLDGYCPIHQTTRGRSRHVNTAAVVHGNAQIFGGHWDSAQQHNSMPYDNNQGFSHRDVAKKRDPCKCGNYTFAPKGARNEPCQICTKACYMKADIFMCKECDWHVHAQCFDPTGEKRKMAESKKESKDKPTSPLKADSENKTGTADQAVVEDQKELINNEESKQENPTIDIEGGKWILVRQVVGKKWHPAKDQLKGTEEYGDGEGKNGSFSIKFDHMDFTEFLFTTGNLEKWLIAKRDDVIGSCYSNEKRKIQKSSLQDSGYTAKWYRRKNHFEDPWISLGDHKDCRKNGDVLYGGNSQISWAHHLEQMGGARVYIRE